MTSLPDTYMPDGPIRRQQKVPSYYTEAAAETSLMTPVLRAIGVGCISAAGGMWLIPVVPGDALMQLTKLLLSACMAVGGVMLFGGSRRTVGPEVHIDTRARRIMIIERDAKGRVQSETSHEVDLLSEIVLRDNLLTARDAHGRTMIALPVRDPAVENALMAMLSRARA
ncbi:hypothetical protein OO012_15710 [Rhodobacteraceae bacterium KMM 6894]|nr:hypothetical protein [Rhodobacteraceae bacterium KMM 6894]